MTRTRMAGAFVALLGLLFGGALLTAPSANALLKVKCKQTVGTAAVDPIVAHNQPDAMVHDHQFFGNNGWLSKGNSANYEDLVSQGTNCREVVDTAGYWTPTLRYKATGQAIPVRAFTAYYRPFTGVPGPSVGEGRAFPADTRLIGTVYNWTCGQNEKVAPSQSIPDCSMADGTAGSTLTLHVDFPSCWNGVPPNHSNDEVGNTNDSEDYAYPVKVNRKKVCPAAFPIKMTALREAIQFQYTGKGNDVELSSDPMKGTTDGMSAHADFWNTWQQQGFEDFIRRCVNNSGPKSLCDK